MPLAKISVVAANYGVSRHTVYDWIRRGIIPETCLIRIGASLRIDPEKFRDAVDRGEVRRLGRHPHALSADLTAEDSHTTTGPREASEHRWTSETGRVRPEHPFNPEMVTRAK